MSDDYAPFPEQELEDVAKYHDDAASIWGEGSWAHRTHTLSAKICRDALAAHLALRERFLLAETERRAALGKSYAA